MDSNRKIVLNVEISLEDIDELKEAIAELKEEYEEDCLSDSELELELKRVIVDHLDAKIVYNKENLWYNIGMKWRNNIFDRGNLWIIYFLIEWKS